MACKNDPHMFSSRQVMLSTGQHINYSCAKRRKKNTDIQAIAVACVWVESFKKASFTTSVIKNELILIFQSHSTIINNKKKRNYLFKYYEKVVIMNDVYINSNIL